MPQSSLPPNKNFYCHYPGIRRASLTDTDTDTEVIHIPIISNNNIKTHLIFLFWIHIKNYDPLSISDLPINQAFNQIQASSFISLMTIISLFQALLINSL